MRKCFSLFVALALSVSGPIFARSGYSVQYGQGMGATGPDGLVVSFPLSPNNSAAQYFVDTVNGDNGTQGGGNFNGLSPCPGHPLNGTGPNFQIGATNCSATSNSAYGPFNTVMMAYHQIPSNGANRVGNQILMAQGQSFYEGGANVVANFNGTSTVVITRVISGQVALGQLITSAGVPISRTITGFVSGTYGGAGTYTLNNGTSMPTANNQFALLTLNDSWTFRSGESIQYPFVWQSYDNTGAASGSGAAALNLATQGRATGANRPILASTVQTVEFTGAISGNTATITPNGSTGTVNGTLLPGMIWNSPSVIAGTWLIANLQNAASAVVGNAGSGYTTGTQTLTVVGGDCQIQPQFSVTVSGGVVSAPVLATAGLCVSPPTGQASTTGGGGTGATLTVTYAASSNWTVSQTQTFAAEAATAGGVGSDSVDTYGVFAFSANDNPNPGSGVGPRGNYALRGIQFNSGTYDGVDAVTIGSNGNVYNALIENDVGVGVGFGAGAVAALGSNVIIRKSSTYGNYSDSSAHYGGIGTGHTNNLVLEDNIVYHAGWPIGTNRQEAIWNGVASNGVVSVASGLTGAIATGQTINSNDGHTGTVGSNIDSTHWNFTGMVGVGGGTQQFWTVYNHSPDIFKHNFYPSYGATMTLIERRNVSIAASANGFAARGGWMSYNNVYIDNPIAYAAGGAVAGAGTYITENPGGVNFSYNFNLTLGCDNINASTGFSRADGFPPNNGQFGSAASHNLFVNCPYYGVGNNWLFNNTAQANTPSYIDLGLNVACSYSNVFDLGVGGANSAFPAQVLTTYGNAASTTPPGTNTNSSTCPNGTTNLQVYQALGYSTEQALINAMIAAPEQPWANMILQTAGPMFGVSFPVQ